MRITLQLEYKQGISTTWLCVLLCVLAGRARSPTSCQVCVSYAQNSWQTHLLRPLVLLVATVNPCCLDCLVDLQGAACICRGWQPCRAAPAIHLHKIMITC